MAYIVSVDQSTVGTKAMVWDERGRLLGREDLPHRQIKNEKGWVSHDPEEIYRNTAAAVKKVLEKAALSPDKVSAIGISNQRETSVVWNRETGKAFCDAVVWQCGRAAEFIKRISYPGFAEKVRDLTGLNLSPYFSGAKFGWVLANYPEAKEALERGILCCGTIDTWLVFKMTGGRSFKTDFSNASRTQLLDLGALAWNEGIVGDFGLKPGCLPEICMSDACFGETSLEGLFKKPVPIHGVLADSSASLFGNQCRSPGMAKVTYGTGSSVMVNTGTIRPSPGPGVVASLAWGMEGRADYALEGNINYSGAIIKWLAEEAGLINSPAEAGEIAASAGTTGGVYFVPAFSGLGAPWFSDSARAAIVGMNRGTGKAQIVRAAEESIAYQIKDVIRAIDASTGRPLSSIRADGGATRDPFLMQFQADILGIELRVSGIEELSGAGAAYCAAIGAGLSTREKLFSEAGARIVRPAMEAGEAERLYEGWKKAVSLITGPADFKGDRDE
ncbi:MAG: glycerol kinase [Treponema sp.]|jgi:glycerol kinase|nr:glycerol kinase [Treponema sp.]